MRLFQRRDGQIVGHHSSKGRQRHLGGVEFEKLPEQRPTTDVAAALAHVERTMKGEHHVGRVQVSRSPAGRDSVPLDGAALDAGRAYAVFLNVTEGMKGDWKVTYQLDTADPQVSHVWPYPLYGSDERGFSRHLFDEGRHEIACTVEDLTDGWTKTVTAVFWVD